MPGDCNQDGRVDISDAICIFSALFAGGGPLPCGHGLPLDDGNRALLDWQPDGRVDLSDVIAGLMYLFEGGPAHPLGAAECVLLFDCPQDAVCQ